MRLFFAMLLMSCLVLTLENCGSSSKGKAKKGNLSQKELKDLFFTLGQQMLTYEKIGNLKIGLSLSKTINLLGEPSDKSKQEQWGSDGDYHQTLTFKERGIEVEMKGKDNQTQKVDQITAIEPCQLKTKKKIGIGSSVEEVKTAYKRLIDPKASDSKTIVAGSVYGGLIFEIESGKVKQIVLGAVAE